MQKINPGSIKSSATTAEKIWYSPLKIKRINSDGQSFINLFCEFRNLRIDKKSGEQSIGFRIYTKTKNSIDEIYKKAIQINLTRFTNLINSKRSDYKQEKWEKMKAKIDEIQ